MSLMTPDDSHKVSISCDVLPDKLNHTASAERTDHRALYIYKCLAYR